MDFRENLLGVKIIDNYVAIEKANPFGDISKYDFLYSDFLSSDWNGNYCFGSNIRVLNGKDAFYINGWKLIELKFPGDWHGNWAYGTVEDKYGKTYTVQGTSRAIYPNSYMHMLRDVLTNILDFTRKTPCVSYKEIMDGIKAPSGKISLEEFHKLVEDLDQYIIRYKNLKDDFAEDSEEIILPLKRAAKENITKFFGIEIDID